MTTTFRTAPTSDIEWTRANLAEVFPEHMSPQALHFYGEALDRGERAFFGRLLKPEAELGRTINVFHGRLYFNLSQLLQICRTVGAAPANILRSLGHSEQIRPEDEAAPKARLADLWRVRRELLRLALYDVRRKHLFREHQARINRMLARFSASDPSALSDRDIWATIEWWIDLAPDLVPPVLVMSNVQGREDAIRKACRQVGFDYARLVYPQLAAGKRSVSSQQACDLVVLADIARGDSKARTYLLGNDGTFADFRTALAETRFLEGLDGFLAEYGHRGRYESDWAIPRMHENPALVLFAVREQLTSEAEDPREVAARQSADAAAAWNAFEARLTQWQKWTLLPKVRATIRELKQQYLWREQVRSDLTRALSALRPWHLALADRFVERGWIDRRDDYFLLHLEEVAPACADPAAGAGLREIAARRASELEAERNVRMPLFMHESELPVLRRATSEVAVSAARELTGLCVSLGIVEAEVVVMHDPSEFTRMTRGAILVARATDPSWTPLFTLASGVIVEVGGTLSHASTIAREYGLPALANVKDATKVLRTGDRVELDASHGVVRRRKSMPPE